LRFYRNAFIEHLDEPRQQGTILDFSGGRSRLSAYKWGFDSNDEAAIKDFKKRMLAKGINLPQEVRPRHYVQLLFDHISEVPDDLIKDALGLVEHIGIDSPEPEDLIEGVDGYLTFLFGFMEANLSDSRLSKC
jgi:hypothetical protein